MPCGASLPGLRVPDHRILAQDRVYYVGHPVAVVVATDKYIARDAADLSKSTTIPTPGVGDPELAMKDGAPLVHPEYGDNVAFRYHQEGGDIVEGVRRSRCRCEAAHHQPASDSHVDGNSRRRCQLECR